jgi:RHS repeat-associated protein
MANQTVEASGTSLARTTTTTWDSTWREPDKIVQPTVTTAITYNAAGAPTKRTLTDNTTFTTPYATNGRTRSWNYAWNTAGQLTAVHGPLWVSGGTIDTTSYGYNSSGYLQTITNALSQATTVTSWDWRGAPLSVTDPNGVITTFTYDIHGRLTQAIVNPGSTQSEYQFQYDAVGDLTLVTLPMGATLAYVYDAGRRMTKVTNVRGETRAYTYDNMDNPLTLTTETATGTVTQSHAAMYDDWGRITQSIGAASQIWALAYDKLNNLTSVADPILAGQTSPNTRAYAFDALNRLTTATDPESHAVNYAYDASDTLNQLTDARSLVTSRVIDGFGEVILEQSPDRGKRTYWYDGGGNLIKLLDGDNTYWEFTYDAANRRITETFPFGAAYNMAFTYDQTSGNNYGIGRLTQVTDSSGSTSYTYDAQGRVTAAAKVISGGGYTTPFTVGYGYDANGKVTRITYPSGDVVTIARATDGQVTGVTQTPAGGSAQTIASGVTYEPFGPLAGLTYGNGLTLTRSYDKDYRLTGISVAPSSGAAILGLGFSWQPDGRLLSVSDPAGTGRAASFGYTPSGRVASGVGPWGSYAYAFDAAGNRTQSGTASAPVVATVATASNQVTQTSQGGVTQRTLTYGTGGNLSTDAHAGGVTYSYIYSANKRMITAKQNGTVKGSYAYDFQGARVWRETYGTGAAQTAYVYDEAGHLLAEHNAVTGAVNREYVWIDDLPVALINVSGGTETTDFIHTGQIDEPLAVTSSTKALVWNAYVDPFGVATTFTTPTTTLDMRLPGQSFQLEPNSLHQNHWRDYDPSLGRYIEADPLGIDAGQNVYAYVDGDPVNFEDPWGLCAPGTHPATPSESQDIIQEAKNYLPRHLTHAQLQCNQLVDRSINAANPGTITGEPNTQNMRNGQVGAFEQVSAPGVGDVLLLNDPGHVVIITGVDGGQVSQFIGSQSSSGPAVVNVNAGGYWSRKISSAGNVTYFQICIPD